MSYFQKKEWGESPEERGPPHVHGDCRALEHFQHPSPLNIVAMEKVIDNKVRSMITSLVEWQTSQVKQG